MTWQTILKADKTGTHGGKDVTHMYHFLKRYFSQKHTEQFKQIYIEWEELSDQDKQSVVWTLERMFSWGYETAVKLPRNQMGGRTPKGYTKLTHNVRDRKWFPGIHISILNGSTVKLEFDDAEHIKTRGLWIEGSDEKTGRGYQQSYWHRRTKPAPADVKIQRWWKELTRTIKKTSNYSWRHGWGSYSGHKGY